ncbi:MAG: DoxX family protein [Planctomycetota bacterium]
MAVRHPRHVDVGLLILRLGIGALFIAHGWGKLAGGPQTWAGLGNKLKGLVSVPLPAWFWGFMAMFAELGGGIALVLGVFVHAFAVLLFVTMAVAVMTKWPAWPGMGYPLAMAAVTLALFFLGPGRYSPYEPIRRWAGKWRAKRSAKKASRRPGKGAGPTSSKG